MLPADAITTIRPALAALSATQMVLPGFGGRCIGGKGSLSSRAKQEDYVQRNPVLESNEDIPLLDIVV